VVQIRFFKKKKKKPYEPGAITAYQTQNFMTYKRTSQTALTVILTICILTQCKSLSPQKGTSFHFLSFSSIEPINQNFPQFCILLLYVNC